MKDESVDELELLLGRVLRLGVTLSSIALGAGLVLALLYGAGRTATMLLTSGIVILIGTPVARVAMSTLGYARRRDWLFAALTLVVLGELIASIAAAVRSLG